MTGLTGPALALTLQQWGNPTPEREGRLSGPREEWNRDLECYKATCSSLLLSSLGHVSSSKAHWGL